MLRTTTAVTIFNAGVKDNVMPSYGEFYVNHRIHSRQTCAQVLEHDLKVINDKRVTYEILSCVEPSPISPTNSLAFTLLEHTTKEIYNDVAIIPSIICSLIQSAILTDG
jgi:carboxypeptidase PM20D1